MIFYTSYIVISIVLGVSIFFDKYTRYFALFACFSFFFVVAGIRGENVGIDTLAYHNIFDVIANASNPFELRYEPGFTVLNMIVAKFEGAAPAVILISALITFFPIFLFLAKYSKNYLLSVAIFTGGFGLTFMFNGVRQGIALGIVMLALDAFIRNKVIFFLGLVCLASMFHYTAFIFILALFSRLKFNFLLVLFAWIASLFFLVPQVSGSLLSLFSNIVPSVYSHYVIDIPEPEAFRLRLIADQALFIFLLYYYANLERFSIDKAGLIIVNLVLFGAVLSNVFYHWGYIARVSSYFVIFGCVAVPYVLSSFISKRSVWIAASLIFFIYSIFFFRALSLGTNGVVPYSTIFSS